MNSVMESLYHGVPLVTLPQMVEQDVNARRVEELGLGVRLDPAAVTPEQLRRAVTSLLDDDATHARLAYLRASARDAGGAVAAADAIEKHLGV
jgi:MGT family glycosyltransferase